MADSFVQVTEGIGKKIDNEEVTVGANTVYRQRVQVTGAQAATIAQVSVGAGSTAIIAANLKRQGLTIHNQSAIEILAVKFGTAAVYAAASPSSLRLGSLFDGLGRSTKESRPSSMATKVRRLGEIAFSTDDASAAGVPVILACQLWQTNDPTHRLLMRMEYGARDEPPKTVELKLDFNMARNLTTLLGGVNWLLFAELPDHELRELRAKLNGAAAPTI